MPIGFHLDDIERESFSNPQGIYELNQQIRNLKKQLETARAEAIREFAERLISKYSTWRMDSEISVDMFVCDVKRLAKELTEQE